MKHFIIIFFTFISTSLFAQFSGGNGTESDPYQIATYNDLEYLSNNNSYWDSSFIQTANINASASNNGGIGFSPIGTYKVNTDYSITKTPFTGIYDGDNHTVSNLYTDRDGNVQICSDIGLFGYTVGATIKNLGVENADISGYNSTGALVGSAKNTTVINCHSSGTVYGKNYQTGGLIGKIIENTIITDCYSSCNTTGFRETGGLVGYSYIGIISNSHATGEVFGHQGANGMDPSCVGGLVGSIIRTKITNSYATGKTSTGSHIGGLIGLITEGNGDVYDNKIIECYATGNVSGLGEVGGLIGRVQGWIQRCYATGNVSGEGANSTNIGGFVGKNNEGIIFYCYARGNVSGHTKVGGFAGENYVSSPASYGSISYCYSTGTATANSGHEAGFCAHNEGEIFQCFWNTETSGHTQGFYDDVNSGDYTGLSTQEMQSIAGFGNTFGFGGEYPSWAIATSMNNGFPVLFWQIETTSLSDLGTVSLDNSISTTASFSCTLTSLGMPNPAKHGFCYSTTSTTPTINDSKKNLGDVTGSTQAGTSFSGTIENLDSSLTYYVRAYATNYEGTVYSENVLELNNLWTNNVNNVNNNPEIKIYPNPVKDILTIELNNQTELKNNKISIYNSEGNILYSSELENSKQEINISNYPTGIYFIAIENETKKIIKE